MTARVSTVKGKTFTTIRIDGQLTSTVVEDVTRACASAEPPLRLDLSGVRSVDPDGIRALLTLMRAGAKLDGANPYISRLLLESST